MHEKPQQLVKKPTVLDLFCGAGGMSLGFQNAGCEILGGIDKNPHAIKTHHKNFPDCKFKLSARDIHDVNLYELPLQPGEVDILIGGPPCQVFSVVGRVKIKSLSQSDIDRDRRNFLYNYFVNFLCHYKPLFFAIENVNTLKSHKFFSTMIAHLAKGLHARQRDYPGYDIEYQVLQASDYGVPQRRKRLFIVGVRKDLGLKFEFPRISTEKTVSVGNAIGDLIPLTPPYRPLGTKSISQQIDSEKPYLSLPQSEYQEKMRKTDADAVMNHICRSHNPVDLICFAMLSQGGKYTDLPEFMRRYRWDIFNDKYKRLPWDEPAWTLTAHMQKDGLAYIHPTQTRSISVREAARLQSFPDDFIFDAPMTRMFELVGNSVPPLLAEAIARPIVEQVQAYYESL